MAVDMFKLALECGCAAKVSAGQLAGVFKKLYLPRSPNLLVGPETLDDAGIYKLDEECCLVQSVDFFPPVARDPVDYGRIAAANSLSDIYAMGGTPLTALAIVCFPASSVPIDVLTDITQGAVEKLTEAGAVLAGGHSIVDSAPKYGLAVTGIVHLDKYLDNARAKPGDVLILTKPLGTGITLMAVKAEMAGAEREKTAVESMASLNAAASRIAVESGVRACTDITGFGMLGHSCRLAEASGVSLELFLDAIPKLDGVIEYAQMGLLSALTYGNREYVGERVRFDESLSLAERDLMFDPQTSGGLLIAVPPETADACLQKLNSALPTPCDIVGRVTERLEQETVSVLRNARGD